MSVRKPQASFALLAFVAGAACQVPASWSVVAPQAILEAALSAVPAAPSPPAADPGVGVPVPGAFVEQGPASWYGREFHGLRTASGEVFDCTARTAAHPSLPLGSIVRIDNLENGKWAIVRVNDRGPYHENRIVDCSMRVAESLGFLEAGVASVQVTLLDSIGSAVAFAGRGARAFAPLEDSAPEAPLLAEVAAPLLLVPASPTAGREAGREDLVLRKASVLPFPALFQAGRRLFHFLAGPYADVDLDLGLPRPQGRIGLRAFVQLFFR